MARIEQEPAEYFSKVTFSSLIMSLTVMFVYFIFASGFSLPLIFSPIIFILFFFIFIYTFLNKPKFNSLKAEQLVESEIVSCIRFLTLELKSERSIYHALIHASNNFSLIGIYFDEIIDKVKMGKTLEQAISEAVELCPSSNLRNLYWQLLNTLQTGADIADSLKIQLEDIIEGQKIKIEEYGRELNALSLFYMMVSIIIPTVGFTIVTAVLTFIGFPIGFGLLLGVWIFLSLIQYFFLMLTASRRPAVEAY